MLRMLTNDGDASADAIELCIGKELSSVRLDPDGNRGDGRLLLGFGPETLQIQDTGRSCCESRYMHTDDDLSSFVGAKLVGIEVKSAPAEPMDHGAHDMQFLVITTTNGNLTLVTHNEHNGYYGGFWIDAKIIDDGEGTCRTE